MAVLMAVPKYQKVVFLRLGCSISSISLNDFEVLTFHRPVIKDDQRQLINIIWGNLHLHPPFSTSSFGCNEPRFGALPWKEQLPPRHLLHNKVSVPPVMFEMWLVSRTRSIYSSSAQLAASSHDTVLLLSWRISAGKPPLAFCTALKLSNILHHVLFQHKRNRSLPLADHYSLVLFKQF